MNKFDYYQFDKSQIKPFRKAVIKYYRSSGRKIFPWRHTKDPWLILLSEFLLRKTTARQIIPVYQYLSTYSVYEIAVIPVEKLEKILKPIGMQKEKSRLLNHLANIIIESEELIFKNVENLIRIPGIGRYAASAVQCFAYNKPLPALDRNMIRVLNRVFNITSEKKRPHTDNKLWRTAEMIIYPLKPKEYNWGVLDLSADVCRPKSPKCEICICHKFCYFNLN